MKRIRCAWPECVSRFNSSIGPATPGWVACGAPGADVVLCPFHAREGHVPALAPVGKVLRIRCSCDWLGGLAVEGMTQWRGHVQTAFDL